MHDEGKMENLIDKLQISEIGFANIIAPSLRNLADILSIPAVFSGFKSSKIFKTSSLETNENFAFQELNNLHNTNELKIIQTC